MVVSFILVSLVCADGTIRAIVSASGWYDIRMFPPKVSLSTIAAYNRGSVKVLAQARVSALLPRLASRAGWPRDRRPVGSLPISRFEGDAAEYVAVRVPSFDLERGALLGGDHPGTEV